jgi:hypothetical protein
LCPRDTAGWFAFALERRKGYILTGDDKEDYEKVGVLPEVEEFLIQPNGFVIYPFVRYFL